MKTRDASQVLEESFLETRAKLLEVAATLDRIDRAGNQGPLNQTQQDKLDQLMQAIEILRQQPAASRAAQIQQLFSRLYDPDWREQLGVAAVLPTSSSSESV